MQNMICQFNISRKKAGKDFTPGEKAFNRIGKYDMPNPELKTLEDQIKDQRTTFQLNLFQIYPLKFPDLPTDNYIGATPNKRK